MLTELSVSLFSILLLPSLHQGRRKVAEAAGAAPWKGHERQRRDKFVGGSGDILPRNAIYCILSGDFT